MRIMLDSNIMISAVLFPSSGVSRLVEKVLLEHQLVLCSHIIDELHLVIERKFSDKKKSLERFLLKLPFEFIYTPKDIDQSKYPDIRDPKDLPVLVSAILADVDILISGDKDFSAVDIEKPEILTPKGFFEKYT